MSETLARQMPPVQYAPTNGLSMAYYEVAKGQGVPVVFCHGFPELAFSWRHQLRAFEKAGRWAIAPDQRGYGLTGGTDRIEDYDMKHLTDDLIGLLDAKGIEKAIFCGHDWGGGVVWAMPHRYPDRCAGIIGVNTPYNAGRSPIDPIEGMRAAMGEDMYIVWFQKPGVADAVLGADAEKSMRMFMRRPAETLEDYQKRPAEERRLAFGDALKAYDPKNDPPETRLLTEDELKAFAETFQRTGFTGGINWYRNITKNWRDSEGQPNGDINLPCLMITAENDVVLSPAIAEPMKQWIKDLEYHLVKGSGHWTQQEKPEEVNRVLLDWVNRRFPK